MDYSIIKKDYSNIQKSQLAKNFYASFYTKGY